MEFNMDKYTAITLNFEPLFLRKEGIATNPTKEWTTIQIDCQEKKNFKKSIKTISNTCVHFLIICSTWYIKSEAQYVGKESTHGIWDHGTCSCKESNHKETLYKQKDAKDRQPMIEDFKCYHLKQVEKDKLFPPPPPNRKETNVRGCDRITI